MKVDFKTAYTKPSYGIGFRQITSLKSMINKPAAADVFLCNKTSIAQTKLYEKISNATSQVSAKDIEEIISRMTKGLPRETILLAMDKLTSYSNMQSMVELGKKLGRINLQSFYDFGHNFKNELKEVSYGVELPIKKALIEGSIYTHDTVMSPEEYRELYKKGTVYQNRYKGFMNIPHAQSMPLSAIFGYLFNTGKCGSLKGKYTGLLLDSNTLDIIKKDKEKNPNMFELYMHSFDSSYQQFDCYIPQFQPVYIENFENTYNIFEQHKDFGKETEKLARRIISLKKNNPRKSEEQIADMILNRKNLKEIKELGFNPIVIKAPSSENPTPQSIADKMSPLNPTKQEFDEKFDVCLAKLGHKEDSGAREFLIKYLNDNLKIYSPKKLSEKLIELKQKIEEDVKAHGKPVDRIYYNILNPKKSFGLVSYMYQKANDIPENRFLYWNQTELRFVAESLLKILPKDSTLVFLDDNMISGSCLLRESFPYENLYSMKNIMKKLDNIDFIFANVLSFEDANRRLGKASKQYGRENKDRIVSLDTLNMADISESEYFKLLHPREVDVASTAILFPYMAPDNNSPNLRELFKLYYPKDSLLKAPLSNSGFLF